MIPWTLLLIRLFRGALGLLVLGLTAWGVLALVFQVRERWVLVPAVVAWCAVGGWLLVMLFSGGDSTGVKRAGGVYLLSALLLLAWWQTIRPSHERPWADDVSRLLESEIDGRHVTLHNVRNFEWRSETDYDPRWETRVYDLDRLDSADLILSYWMGPHIAHTLVSFGFSDGQRVVFSLEIRKERHEQFSALGGFFREFEQIVVAADERDIVRTRSNARGEAVYLYNLGIPPDRLRVLFLGYLHEAEALRQAPRFYNTLTSNCTTIAFGLARHIAPGLPLDYRLLLSGHLAEYAYEQGALASDQPYEVLQALGHINARAQQDDAPGHPDFSRRIREGVPLASRSAAP